MKEIGFLTKQQLEEWIGRVVHSLWVYSHIAYAQLISEHHVSALLEVYTCSFTFQFILSLKLATCDSINIITIIFSSIFMDYSYACLHDREKHCK